MSLSQPKSPLHCRSRYLLPPFHWFLRFESNLWSLSSWARCIVRLWGVIGHSIILLSGAILFVFCPRKEICNPRGIHMVLKCTRMYSRCSFPRSHFQPPSLALSFVAYMSISQNSIYNRQVDKLYLYFIGTESVPAIFLTFRQVSLYTWVFYRLLSVVPFAGYEHL